LRRSDWRVAGIERGFQVLGVRSQEIQQQGFPETLDPIPDI
jgi:hypothetical protein